MAGTVHRTGLGSAHTLFLQIKFSLLIYEKAGSPTRRSLSNCDIEKL